MHGQSWRRANVYLQAKQYALKYVLEHFQINSLTVTKDVLDLSVLFCIYMTVLTIRYFSLIYVHNVHLHI